jgi:ribosomal protein L3 glutamine methyltransferase
MSEGVTDIKEGVASTLTTIKDYIRWGASQIVEQKVFLGHGLASPLHESAAIVFPARFTPYNVDGGYLEAVLTLSERKKILALFDKRIKDRHPVAYIVNEAIFAGLSFYVDERVLVPRSPIAELIEQRFEPWVEEDQVLKILDLCTGSGCIAIACAYAFPEAQVDAVELSGDALEVARINLEKHELTEQLNLFKSDLFNDLPKAKYDVIVSNPPYVAIQEWQELPAEYHKEPEMGFTGGKTGLDLVLRILADAQDFLSEQGILIIEVGSSAETLQHLFPQLPFYWLEFERGGDGVFLLTVEQVRQYHTLFSNKI